MKTVFWAFIFSISVLFLTAGPASAGITGPGGFVVPTVNDFDYCGLGDYILNPEVIASEQYPPGGEADALPIPEAASNKSYTMYAEYRPGFYRSLKRYRESGGSGMVAMAGDKPLKHPD